MTEAAEERRDPRNTQKILRVLDKLEARTQTMVSEDDLQRELKSHVRYSTLVPWLGAAAVVMVGAVWAVVSDAKSEMKDDNRAVIQRTESAMEKAVGYMGDVAKSIKADVSALDRKVSRSHRATRRGERPADLETPAVMAPLPEPPAIRDGGP